MPKSRKTSIDFNGYKPPEELAPNRRVAHCLNWAAEKFPYQYIQWNIMLKAIHGYRRLPRLDSEQVLHLKKSATAVRKHLLKYHERIMDSEPGMGIRALVDDADNLTIAMPKKARRLVSAKNSAEETAAHIDLSAVPDTPEYAPYKKWMKRDMGGILKALERVKFDHRALPPARDEE
jgi:hypothetical protein